MEPAIPAEVIEKRIFLIRGHKVMLDSDLAALYGVPTKQRNQAVRRNIDRFPDDIWFQLTENEEESLRSQIVTLETGHMMETANLRSRIVTSNGPGRGRYRKYPTYAFTEHGIAMLSSVLNSSRAVQVNIAIVRTFVQLRRFLSDHADLARRMDELESRYDEHSQVVFDAVRQLMAPPNPPKRRVGF